MQQVVSQHVRGTLTDELALSSRTSPAPPVPSSRPANAYAKSRMTPTPTTPPSPQAPDTPLSLTYRHARVVHWHVSRGVGVHFVPPPKVEEATKEVVNRGQDGPLLPCLILQCRTWPHHSPARRGTRRRQGAAGGGQGGGTRGRRAQRRDGHKRHRKPSRRAEWRERERAHGTTSHAPSRSAVGCQLQLVQEGWSTGVTGGGLGHCGQRARARTTVGRETSILRTRRCLISSVSSCHGNRGKDCSKV